jgi:hypothetical protein
VADGDGLATVLDNDHLASVLPNLISYQIVDYPLFRHFDFISAVDAGDLVYRDVLAIIENF